MAANRYSVYPSSLVYAGPTTLTIDQIISHSVRTGATFQTVTPGGAVDASAHIMVFGEPVVEFSSDDLKSVLDAISLSAGLSLTGGGTIRYQQRLDGGTFAGSSNNATFTLTKGFAYPTSIQASQDDTSGATVDVRVMALYDGTNAPLVKNTSVSFSGITPAFNQVFHMGPVYLNSSELEAVKSVRIDTGITYEPFRASGDVWARQGSIIQRQPMITVNTTDIDSLTTAIFNLASPGALACYFWKGVAGGSRVAVGTSEHCKISAATSALHSDNYSVQRQDDGTFDVIFKVTGTLAFASNSAIP